MIPKDIRQFISSLDKNGDLIHIKREVDWEMEASAVIRHATETQAQAPLFEKIKDYPEGNRILGAPIDTLRRLAIALGLPPDITREEYQKEYDKRVSHPIKPIIVKEAPCKENILVGKDVDLFRFPIPMLHESDGGRFIGTWHIVITKDPDSAWTNWGMYRVMVHNRRLVGAYLHPGNHGGLIYSTKYQLQGKPMPVAIAIGVSPICTIVGCTAFGVGESEVDFAGGLQMEPVELVKCETNDLFVPAHSEIVLEGETVPGVTVPEGPFAEFTGYRTGIEERPVYRINAITYRNSPVLLADDPTVEITGGSIYRSLSLASNIKRHLLSHGIPVIKVHLPNECAHLAVVVSVKANHSSTIASQIAHIINSNNAPYSSIIILVDEGIDVFDWNEVSHSIATKCHPGRGIHINQEEYVSPLAPYLSKEERSLRKGSKVLFDCTWPVDWPGDSDAPPRAFFKDVFPEEIKKKVLDNWKDYGF